jgi:hypothetical protein
LFEAMIFRMPGVPEALPVFGAGVEESAADQDRRLRGHVKSLKGFRAWAPPLCNIFLLSSDKPLVRLSLLNGFLHPHRLPDR